MSLWNVHWKVLRGSVDPLFKFVEYLGLSGCLFVFLGGLSVLIENNVSQTCWWWCRPQTKQNNSTHPPIFLDILLFNWLCWRWCLLWDHEREKTVSFFSLKCVQKIVLDTISLRREKLPSVFSLILIFCFLCTPPPHATFLENNKINNLLTLLSKFYKKSFPGDPDSKDKESTFNTGGLGSINGLGRCPLEKGMATHFSILAYFSCTVDFGCHLCILSPISDF